MFVLPVKPETQRDIRKPQWANNAHYAVKFARTFKSTGGGQC